MKQVIYHFRQNNNLSTALYVGLIYSMLSAVILDIHELRTHLHQIIITMSRDYNRKFVPYIYTYILWVHIE